MTRMTTTKAPKVRREPRIEDPGTTYFPRAYSWQGWKAFRRKKKVKREQRSQTPS